MSRLMKIGSRPGRHTNLSYDTISKSSISLTSISPQPKPNTDTSPLCLKTKPETPESLILIASKKRIVKKNSSSILIDEKPILTTNTTIQTSNPLTFYDNSSMNIKSTHKDFKENINQDLEKCNTEIEKVEVCQKYLDKIIHEDWKYAESLKIIKFVYENTINNQIETLKDKSKEIDIYEKCKKTLEKEIENAESNNKKLTLKCQLLQKIYSQSAENMIKLVDFKVDNTDRSEDNWQKLMKTNMFYKQKLEETLDQLDYYRFKAKTFLSVLPEFNRKKGNNMQMIFESKCEIKKDNILSNKISYNVVDQLDNECKLLGKPNNRQNYSIVPKLKIGTEKKIMKREAGVRSYSVGLG
ncbi:hypothetical protein SteCoe_14128 [Stentor coeruleus]|uniref:Translin-associated factor X-interacting protein 1 N-terminal domain-containing protein n=1 Tax=Stentor coeruleus TaxID=5963 RepID=A0A1R2C6V1_9CILI|nr:hypothetical protein SteCoe_14128 [Stentor coeruleus]